MTYKIEQVVTYLPSNELVKIVDIRHFEGSQTPVGTKSKVIIVPPSTTYILEFMDGEPGLADSESIEVLK